MSDLTVTVPNVPLVTVGTWQASTGEVTFTAEHLMGAVAAQDDPGIITPRVKPGHIELDAAAGVPALGVVENMRWDPDDLTVYGDIVTLSWMAEAWPVIYPHRSIEGCFDFTSDVTGRTYDFVLDGLALLGIEWPAVTSLDALRTLVTEGVPIDGEPVAAAGLKPSDPGRVIVLQGRAGHQRNRDTMPATTTTSSDRVAAQIDGDDVYRAFYAQFEREHPWWWIRALRLEPDAVIVDDGAGGLLDLPFTVNGTDVEFGEPTPVRVEYVQVAAARAHPVGDIGSVRGGVGRVVAQYSNRSDTRPAPTEDQMDANAIREQLGLAEGASDEDVQAAIADLRTRAGDAPAGNDEGGDGDEGDENAPAPFADPVAAAAANTEGAVLVDAARLAALEQAAAAGQSAAQRLAADDRDREIDAAVKAGKIPPARVDHWRAQWDADSEGARQTLASLAPGLVPVDGAKGAEGNDDPSGVDEGLMARIRAAHRIPTTSKGA